MSEPSTPPSIRIPSNDDKDGSHGGHGIVQVKEVIDHLSSVDIPCCVVGVRALRYHGALGRIADDWDICIPDDKMEQARRLFNNKQGPSHLESSPMDPAQPSKVLTTTQASSYQPAPPAHPAPNSSRHTHPRFKLTGYNFYFIFIPAASFFPGFVPTNTQGSATPATHASNPINSTSPNFDSELNIEYSPHNQIPYPTRKHLASALLIQGNWSDLGDFIDGTNVDVEWGLNNLDFDRLSGLSREKCLNAPDKAENEVRVLTVNELEARWRREASQEQKQKRMGEAKKGRWLTRWQRIPNPNGSARNNKRTGETV